MLSSSDLVNVIEIDYFFIYLTLNTLYIVLIIKLIVQFSRINSNSYF